MMLAFLFVQDQFSDDNNNRQAGINFIYLSAVNLFFG
jgi:hypothetical protein